MWAAAWLYQASNDQYYLDYLGRNGDSMGGTGWQMTEFSWDVKYPGVQTLVAKVTSINILNNINPVKYLSFTYTFNHIPVFRYL